MGENRFTIQKASGMYLHLPIFDNDVEMADGDVCILLNEQQATINELEKNFDDLVEWASEISKRNVVLDEQVGELQRENEQLKIDLESLETTSDATSDYNAHLESKITTLEKENEQLRKEHQEMLEKYVLLKLKIGEVLNDE